MDGRMENWKKGEHGLERDETDETSEKQTIQLNVYLACIPFSFSPIRMKGDYIESKTSFIAGCLFGLYSIQVLNNLV